MFWVYFSLKLSFKYNNVLKSITALKIYCKATLNKAPIKIYQKIIGKSTKYSNFIQNLSKNYR